MLYVVYWGAVEPLGQSLVVPAIQRLSSLGVSVTLLTFEKPWDLANQAERQRIEGELARACARWVPLKYHKRPKWPATVYDVLQGVAHGVASCWPRRPDVIHARTFVGGVMGGLISALVRRPLVYHNEGFYPEEQVDSGVWRKGSLAHRTASSVERALYAAAGGVVALSRSAKSSIEALAAVRRKQTPVIVVPSCVDLERFRWRGPLPWRLGEQLRLVYVGSIGSRYAFQRIAELVASGLKRGLDLHLRVLTPADPSIPISILGACKVPHTMYSIASVAHAEVPRELAAHHAGLSFLTQGRSEHGSSPTKVGEYWAVGLPVVITPNAGDTQEIIATERVGVVVQAEAPRCYETALDELTSLLGDAQLAQRCRSAAERHYSLASGCDGQFELYRSVLAGQIDRRAE